MFRLTLLLVALLAAADFRPELSREEVTAVRGATLVDGRGGPGLQNSVVIVHAGRIAEIGTANRLRLPRGARVIDARGRWLVPGFIDTHAHVNLGPVVSDGPGQLRMPAALSPERSLRTLLAHGVTTIRDPAAPLASAIHTRERVGAGEIPGPRVFTAGNVIDSTSFPGLTVAVSTEDATRAEVRRQIAAGVDWVKVYAALPPPLVRAAIDEAHQGGCKVVGHLFATSWTDAARMGIDSITHAVPSSPLLLTPERRAAWRKTLVFNTRFMFQWFEHVDFASEEIQDMTRAMAQRRVTHDPTLVVFEAMAWGDSPRVTGASDLALVDVELLENWRKVFTLTTGWSAADYAAARNVWPTVLRFVKHLHDAGVVLTIGTDANNPWVVPGVSFHRELQLLADAGIPPAALLRMATRNGAEALGVGHETGTIEPGKRADLVLLRRDPLINIVNTTSIEWVMQGGRRWEPNVLLQRQHEDPVANTGRILAAR